MQTWRWHLLRFLCALHRGLCHRRPTILALATGHYPETSEGWLHQTSLVSRRQVDSVSCYWTAWGPCWFLVLAYLEYRGCCWSALPLGCHRPAMGCPSLRSVTQHWSARSTAALEGGHSSQPGGEIAGSRAREEGGVAERSGMVSKLQPTSGIASKDSTLKGNF